MSKHEEDEQIRLYGDLRNAFPQQAKIEDQLRQQTWAGMLFFVTLIAILGLTQGQPGGLVGGLFFGALAVLIFKTPPAEWK